MTRKQYVFSISYPEFGWWEFYLRVLDRLDSLIADMGQCPNIEADGVELGEYKPGSSLMEALERAQRSPVRHNIFGILKDEGVQVINGYFEIQSPKPGNASFSVEFVDSTSVEFGSQEPGVISKIVQSVTRE